MIVFILFCFALNIPNALANNSFSQEKKNKIDKIIYNIQKELDELKKELAVNGNKKTIDATDVAVNDVSLPEKIKLSERIDELMNDGAKDAAIKMLEQVIDFNGTEKQEAYYLLGKIYYDSGEYQQSCIQFTRSYKIDNKTKHAAKSLYMLSESLIRINKINDAKAVLQKIIDDCKDYDQECAMAKDKLKELS